MTPAVMFIEMAMDSLKRLDPSAIARMLKEFDSLGPTSKQDVLTSLQAQTSEPIAVGFLLGFVTARVILAGMPAAVQAGVHL